MLSSIKLYRNATTFGKSAVDLYMRHEGTFFTKDFRWELADAGDFLSMAVSGLGATTSAAGMASGISDAAKTYRQWKKTDALKNSIRQNAMGAKGETNGVGDLPGCFIAGTPVKTADGDKSIEEVSVGDEVLSYDVYTGEFGYKKVRQVYVHQATELAHVQVDNETITATTNHPFYVVGYGFLEAGRLQAGDRILLASGEVQEVEGIVIEHLEEPVRVYNFEVEDWHTYFVGEKGVLVHNVCNVNGITEKSDSDSTTRVRHYTNSKGLKGIEESGVIYAQDNNRVYMEVANKKPMSPKKAEKIYQLGKGKGRNYVEFDVDSKLLEWIENPRYHRMELTIKGDVKIKNAEFFKRY